MIKKKVTLLELLVAITCYISPHAIFAIEAEEKPKPIFAKQDIFLDLSSSATFRILIAKLYIRQQVFHSCKKFTDLAKGNDVKIKFKKT